MLGLLFLLASLVNIVRSSDTESAEQSYQEYNAGRIQHVLTACSDYKHLSLTFDDGISPYTEDLLDVLNKHQVKATFFILGHTLSAQHSEFAKNKQLLKRMVREGHIIASHTWSHPDLASISASQIESQMKETEAAIKSIIGVRPRFMRPPYGSVKQGTVDKLRDMGYYIVNWNRDTNDWKHQESSHLILSYVKSGIANPKSGNNGTILLQHDTYEATVMLQDKIISDLKKKGFELVTLDKCIRHRPYRR